MGLAPANKSLLFSDPSVCVWDRHLLSVCVLACLFTRTWVARCVSTQARVCVCAWPRVTCFRKGNEIHCVLSPSPTVSHFFLLLHLHFLALPCRNRRAKICLMDRSAEWLLLLSRPQKLQQLNAIETFTFIFLKQKRGSEWGRKETVDRKPAWRDLIGHCLRGRRILMSAVWGWRWRTEI